MATVFEQVKSIVAEQLGVNEAEITMDSSFIDDLGADSLDLVELIMALEDKLNIQVSDEDAEKLTTVKSLMEYLARAGIKD